MITLRYPNDGDKAELEKACHNEWAEHWGLVHYWETIIEKDLDKLINFLPRMEKGYGVPQGHVQCTFLFAFNESNEIIGRTSIRHGLTAFLLHEGGHIGYGVMPDQRRKGYATEILKLSLEYCKNNLELNRVLVTCDDDNIGSWKTIEKNGGVLENKVTRADGKQICRRYWIDIC